MKIKNSNYVGLQGWQVNELGLNSNSLIIYAIIFQYKEYHYDPEQLSMWTGLEEESIWEIVSNLEEAGFIKITSKIVKGSTVEVTILSVNYEG